MLPEPNLISRCRPFTSPVHFSTINLKNHILGGWGVPQIFHHLKSHFFVSKTPMQNFRILVCDLHLHWNLTFSCPKALQAGGHLHLACVCVSESVTDNFEPCDWPTRFMRVISLSLSSDKPVLQQSVCRLCTEVYTFVLVEFSSTTSPRFSPM